MSEEKKENEDWNIPIQVVETVNVSAAEVQPQTGPEDSAEVPTITSLLNRKKLNSGRQEIPESSTPQEVEQSVNTPSSSEPVIVKVTSETPVGQEPIITPSRRKSSASTTQTSTSLTHHDANKSLNASQGEPPVFNKALVLEALELKAFQKALKKNKNSPDLKKLDCLGYFSKWFMEMAYFSVQSQELVQGVLGYGNPTLVTGIRSHHIHSGVLPSVFDIVAQGEVFVGSLESLRAEDQKGLQNLGFKSLSSVAIIPMIKKKHVVGIWICAAPQNVEISPKEMKSIKKIFSDLIF